MPHASIGWRFLACWVMDRVGSMRWGVYAVVLVLDARGDVVHRTCILPNSFRSRFMEPRSSELSAI